MLQTCILRKNRNLIYSVMRIRGTFSYFSFKVISVISLICILTMVLYHEFLNNDSGILNRDVNQIVQTIFIEETRKMDHKSFNVKNHRQAPREGAILPPQCTGFNKDVHPRPDLDLFKKGPFSLDKHFKNPCWYDTLGRLRCLPLFYLAGMPKSGTTNMFDKLLRHPDIRGMSQGQHWLSRSRFTDVKQTFEWWTSDHYISKIWIQSNKIKNRKKDIEDVIIGDGTVSVFWDFFNWPSISGNENCFEPRITNPYLVHHLYPDSKIIVMFRNPTDRAYSDFLYFLTKNTTVEEFHTHCYDAIKIIKECVRKFGERYCIFNSTITNQLKVRLHVGLYSVFMKEWLNVFSRDQILDIRLEELSENPYGILTKAFEFLDVAPLPNEQLQKILLSENKNEGKRKRRSDDMLPETRSMLNDFYSFYNREMALLMNDVNFVWS